MEMHIADAADCLAWEARRVEVIDIAVLGVEQIEDFERQPHAFADLVAGLEVDEPRRFRSNRGALDQRTRTEVAQPRAAEF